MILKLFTKSVCGRGRLFFAISFKNSQNIILKLFTKSVCVAAGAFFVRAISSKNSQQTIWKHQILPLKQKQY